MREKRRLQNFVLIFVGKDFLVLRSRLGKVIKYEYQCPKPEKKSETAHTSTDRCPMRISSDTTVTNMQRA